MVHDFTAQGKLFYDASLKMQLSAEELEERSSDNLPHQGAQITLLGICKLTHKEAYFDIAVTQILIPILTLFIFIPLVSLGM